MTIITQRLRVLPHSVMYGYVEFLDDDDKPFLKIAIAPRILKRLDPDYDVGAQVETKCF